jgi:hypothetical protein
MAGSRRTYTETSRPEWREVKAGIDGNVSRIMLGGNGSVPFGRILAGTMLEYVDDSGSKKVRPMILQLVAAIATLAEFDVVDASNVYAGDPVNFAAVGDLFGALTVVVGASGAEILFTGKEAGRDYTIEIDDPGGASALLIAVTEGDPTHIVVTLAHSGAAITSTVQDVIDLINDSDGTPYLSAALASGAGAELGIDVAETALTGAALAGELLYGTARTVLSVDKDSTPNTVTLTAAVFVPAGYALVQHGTDRKIAGILEDQPNTAEEQDGAFVAVDRTITVARTGYALWDRLTGVDMAALPYLLGQVPAAGGALGHELQPFIKPFAFAFDTDLL